MACVKMAYAKILFVNWVLKTKVLKWHVLKRCVKIVSVNWVLKTKLLKWHVLKRYVLKLKLFIGC